MPSVSKQQQKFFGLVRSLQKGDVSPSSVTKKARDAAKDMKKSDVKKFASTKHKGLPRKVKGETKVKSLIKKMVREELKKLDEKCWKGYEKKGTKMMFGKRYPNCVKKETIDKLNEKLSKSEIKKMRDKFNKTGKLPPHLMKLAKLMDKHTEVRNIVVPGLEWMSKLGEEKIREAVKFSSSQINQLVKAFKNVKGDVLPKNHPLMTQVTKLLKQTDKKTLQQIKSADIPYLSVIALDLLNEAKLSEQITSFNAIQDKLVDLGFGDMKISWKGTKKKIKDFKPGKRLDNITLEKTHNTLLKKNLIRYDGNSYNVTVNGQKNFKSTLQLEGKLTEVSAGVNVFYFYKKANKDKNKFFNMLSDFRKKHSDTKWMKMLNYALEDFNENPKKYKTIDDKQNKLFKNLQQNKKVYEGKLTEAIQPSKAINKVLDMADGGYGKLGGKLVDGLSANLFKAVYNKANDTNKEKMNKMNEKQLYVFLTKLWTKFGKQVKL